MIMPSIISLLIDIRYISTHNKDKPVKEEMKRIMYLKESDAQKWTTQKRPHPILIWPRRRTHS